MPIAANKPMEVYRGFLVKAPAQSNSAAAKVMLAKEIVKSSFDILIPSRIGR